MKHVHFESCASTQTHLKSELGNPSYQDENIVVSTSNQTDGIGRAGNEWLNSKRSLAFSFTLSPNEEMTLTSIEIGILVCEFFKQNFHKNITLKWPNDLMITPNEKCGGIICHLINPKKLVIGIGINLLGQMILDKNYVASSIFTKEDNLLNFEKELPPKIYQYILNNRLGPSEIIKSWEKLCCHQSSSVNIIDRTSNINGTFHGIDEKGCALIEDDGKIKKIISGSLFID
ncbi:biotin--[acetyl-CoA-carboxylase] ligase [Bacteriovoracaceae bacterium]|nr:biotin--[acetyl-CoA-carboxylase] ligase [Bacteriovoracaceae bacterium]